MEKQINLMNQYVSNLAVLNVKFHNLHWNVVGKQFVSVHVYLEKLYDDFFEKYDEIAERIKMLGYFPKASMKAYLNTSNVKELNDGEISVEEALNIALEEIKELKELSKDIRIEADKFDDFVTVALMEDHISGFDKEIWFIESTLK